ncbi:hypothetical protein [Nonomuraea aurantiaca]|nr:hypothetical protein [Nonomuraea aurantiaca]
MTWPSPWAPNRYRFRSMGARNATMLTGAVIAALNPPEIPGGRG